MPMTRSRGGSDLLGGGRRGRQQGVGNRFHIYHRGSGTIVINVSVCSAGTNGSRPRCGKVKRFPTLCGNRGASKTVPDALWKTGSQTFGEAGGFDGVLTVRAGDLATEAWGREDL